MISGWKIGPRLGLGFGALLGVFVTAWALAAINIEHARGLSSAVTQRHDQTAALAQANGAIWALRAQLAQALATADPAARKQLAEQAAATRRQFNAAEFNYKQASDLDASEEALMRDLGAAFARLNDARGRWFELLDAGQQEAALKLDSEVVQPASAQAVAALQTLTEFKDKQVLAEDDRYAAGLKRSQWLLDAIGVCALGVAALVVWLLTRSITVPLRQAVSSVEAVARGDLGRQIEQRSRDEVGQVLAALRTMQDNLKGLIGEVASGARSVADSSAQIAQGNLDLSQRTEEQASTLEETASSMEELTATVSQNAENARQARQVAAGASQVAARGGEVVGAVVRTMHGISDSSRRISDIIGVIDGIAFQTNILALNAAVEAARAGEQGRGFAVVAAEVRNLAQRSAAAAKEIKTLIVSSVDQVDAGARLVHDAGETMQEIVASVQKVSDLVTEIAAASEEQSQGIGQVSSAVSQMDQVVQQNAALVEEAAAATESMKQQAAALLGAVGRFKLHADGAQPEPGLAAAPAWDEFQALPFRRQRGASGTAVT